MSQLALLTAFRDQLRAAVVDGGLAYAGDECEVMFDGQPPPNCPQVFVAVHPSTWTADLEVEGLDEFYGVDVTVTVRVARIPQSRQGLYSLIGGETGKVLDQHLEQIRALLHKSEAVRAKANVTIGVTENGFVVSPRFGGADRPVPRTADWFSAEQDQRVPPVGVSQALHFVGAERLQVIEEQG